MIIDTQVLIQLVEKHKEHLTIDKMMPLFETRKGDCTNVPDCVLLYLLILEHQPRHVIEFSPMLGYSTRYLASAMKILGRSGCMFSVDRQSDYVEKTQARLQELGLEDFCEVICNEAIGTTINEIKKRGWQNKVGLAFIDSCHSYEFGKRYLEKVLPLFADDCIVMIHDICGENNEVDPHSLDFTTSLRHVNAKTSEFRAIKEFLIETRASHTLTHPLFGGYWRECAWRQMGKEASPELPDNDEFYEAYLAIVGYDLNEFRNFQHPNGLIMRLNSGK